MSLELNKIAAAVLTAGVVAMGTGFVADLLVHPHAPEEPVYKVASKEGASGGSAGGGSAGGGSGGSGGGEEQAPDLATLLANASASDGEKGVRACQACHSFNEGGPNKVGPNLYDVVGAKIASAQDFSYSNALSSKEGKWTYEKLNAWLKNPSGWASGTKMSYPGIKDPKKRADVIAYLRQQGKNPPPLPEPTQKSASASGAGGDGSGSAQTSNGSGDMASGGSDTASGDQANSGGGAEKTQTAKASGATANGGGSSGSGSGSGGGSALEQKIASADPSAGKSATAVCSACHSFNKGGPNKVGPNLYNVLHNDIASHEGFNYSSALKGKEGKWTIQKMNAWLQNPNKFVSGNRMTYPGVKDDQKRHNIIAYMVQQAENAGGN